MPTSPPASASKTAPKTYARLRRAICDCGRPAVITSKGETICSRCYRIESTMRNDHRCVTSGIKRYLGLEPCTVALPGWRP